MNWGKHVPNDKPDRGGGGGGSLAVQSHAAFFTVATAS